MQWEDSVGYNEKDEFCELIKPNGVGNSGNPSQEVSSPSDITSVSVEQDDSDPYKSIDTLCALITRF